MFKGKSIFLELVSVLLVLLSFYFVWNNFEQLPDQVAVHWNLNGEADRWDSPSQLYILPAIGLFLFAFMTILSLKPSLYKYPVPITDQNREAFYSMGVRTMQITKLLSVAMICYLSYSTVRSALSDNSLPNMWPIAVFVAVIIAMAIWSTVRHKKLQ